MKPSVYPCESCGQQISQTPRAGRIKRFCSRECRGRGRYYPEPKRTHCTGCGVALEKLGALKCPACKEAERPLPRERNPYGHLKLCQCSEDCRAHYRSHRVSLTRKWKRRNREAVRAQDARYRARYRETLRERSAAFNRTPERRDYKERWKDENREKVQAQSRATYRRNPERAKAATKAWVNENRDYYRETQRAWREAKDQIITPRALNRRQPWTETELQIALDRTLTLAEAALRLSRTVAAISNQRYRARVGAS